MEFLRPKIIVKKDEEGNYILKKKAYIPLILSLLVLFFIIFTGETYSVIFTILLAGIFLKDNIQIQVNTGLDEDETFYFGAIIGFEGYKKFCEIFRKVTKRDRANIYFTEERKWKL